MKIVPIMYIKIDTGIILSFIAFSPKMRKSSLKETFSKDVTVVNKACNKYMYQYPALCSAFPLCNRPNSKILEKPLKEYYKIYNY